MHNHTYYSYDSVTVPEEIIENAVRHGICRIGISDHQFTIRDRYFEYVEEINRLKRKYLGKINILCGLEIGTRPKPDDFLASESSFLDYCLFESLDSPVGMDLFEFIEWQKLFMCRKGLAHTDIFALAERYNVDIMNILRKNNIFWEINISGNYDYYYDFVTNRLKQRMVSEAGIEVSIGSDNHRICDFDMSRLQRIHRQVSDMGIKCAFDL